MVITMKRRRYDEDFKRGAVKKLLESGKPVTSVAKEIGIDQSILHKWKKALGPGFGIPSCNPTTYLPQGNEVEALRMEIAHIKETVEHLKNIINKSLRDKYK